MTPHEETFTLSTRIRRPAAEVFAWHERPGALQRLSPPWEKIVIVASQGGIRDGATATIRTKVGPFWSTWQIEHRDYVAGERFRDVMLAGPFAQWEHQHEIKPDGPDACVLTDTITYRLPLGWLGRAVAKSFVRRKLERMFAWRHATTKQDLESKTNAPGSRALRLVIAGASGLIGGALVPFLQTQGYEVVRLVRRRPLAPSGGEIFWDPTTGELDATALEGVDAVINLAGENVAGGRWTKARRERILRSRVQAARTLLAALGKLSRRPAVLINAAAVGIYGERGDEKLAETSARGRGFLADVCVAWETEAAAAVQLGIRTTLLRFGVVLSPAGGALAKMLPAFRAGIGGRLGSGKQWMSWIALDDVLGVVAAVLRDERCSGPINVVAPNPVTNREFAVTLGNVLNRPAWTAVPSAILRLAFGKMADETVLASTRAEPIRLQATGYEFRCPTLGEALRHTLGREGKV